MLSGVYQAVKKNGEIYYRASVTYRGKHISLGSFGCEGDASKAYLMSGELLKNQAKWTLDNYPSHCTIAFDKWVVLINFRDNRIYFKNPIYLKKRYFLYYIDKETHLKFDADDLFYYAKHRIMKRGGHLFVSDYGMQVSILSRYGIKNFAVPGKDYIFINGDDTDFSYHNIEVINHYHGVSRVFVKGQPQFMTKIHINGDYKLGCYPSEEYAAIAYNKAALLLNNQGLQKKFPQNYIEGIDEITYATVFQRIKISKRFLSFADGIKKTGNDQI